MGYGRQNRFLPVLESVSAATEWGGCLTKQA